MANTKIITIFNPLKHSKMSDNNLIKWEDFLKSAEVVYLTPQELMPLANNPRIIKDAGFRALMKDIMRDQDFLRQRPILVNKTNDGLFIYAGHQRWRACMELNILVPVCIDEDLSREVMERRMVLDNVHFGVFDASKFSDFDNDMLDDLGLGKLEGRINLKEKLIKEAGDRLKNDTGDSSSKEDTGTHGAHQVTVIFSTQDEQDEFFVLSENLKEGDERLEDALLRTFKN